ncbi:hypothetical protein DV096_03390 [Bradymonadaceae bacterium TMQ3]|nr:hypothetical protein DV096_03390 [Bradymonadaceae bacterium TMQ3]TXC77634.1 hypothetical protein FRC91_02535 [Bradymonadales bacterium TMQ1]
MPLPPIQLSLTYDSHFDPVVELVPTQVQVSNLEELRDALPDLATLQSYGPRMAVELAAAFHHLGEAIQGRIYLSRDALMAMLPKTYNAKHLGEVQRWYRDGAPGLPAPDDLKAPHWKGDALVFVAIDLQHSVGAPFAISSRYTADLASPSWPLTREDIDSSTPVATPTLEVIARTFGGEPDGVLQVSSSEASTHLFVAIWDEETGARFALREAPATDAESQPYDTWPDLIADHPEWSTTTALTALAGALFDFLAARHVREGHYHVIADPDAYRDDYHTNGWETYRLRYYVDQIAETRFQVAGMASIAAPCVEGSRLRAYFKGPRNQPFFWEVDLHTLSLKAPPELTEMATSKLISDTGGYFGRAEAPLPRAMSDDDLIRRDD